MNKQKCPCCGFSTLERLASYEICYLCFWEDDGQGEDELNEVWGGPNGDYSLKKARYNFKNYYLMYDKEDDTVIQTMKQVNLKKQAIRLFEQLEKEETKSNRFQKIVEEIEKNKRKLDEILSNSENDSLDEI